MQGGGGGVVIGSLVGQGPVGFGSRLINARVEPVHGKPAFRWAVAQRG
jgi:hypothetical protein